MRSMVEGVLRLFDDPGRDAGGIRQYFRCGNADDPEVALAKIRITFFVTRSSRTIMGGTIDFDDQHGLAAVEVNDVRPDGVLTAEFEAAGAFAKLLPKKHLRQAHFLPQLTRCVDTRTLARRRTPSTTLRAVPLPLQGRILGHPSSRGFTTLLPWVSRTPFTISSSSGSTTFAASLSQKADRKL